MKTRTIFEPRDFEGRGQCVVRQDAKVGNISYLTSVAYKVGYLYLGKEGARETLVSLADGLISAFDSIENLCQRLNEDPIGFRPLTTDELVAISQWQGNRFPKL